jgi:hypothetical protein
LAAIAAPQNNAELQPSCYFFGRETRRAYQCAGYRSGEYYKVKPSRQLFTLDLEPCCSAAVRVLRPCDVKT